MPEKWCVYLLGCSGGAIYTGITNDVPARFKAHRQGKGARYTRANPPERILAVIEFENRSAAASAEHAIKKMSRREKLDLIEKAASCEPPPSIPSCGP